MSNKELATKFLPKLGLDGYDVKGVESLTEWKGHEVFSPVFPEYVKIGQPVLILVKGGKARQASLEECEKIYATINED